VGSKCKKIIQNPCIFLEFFTAEMRNMTQMVFEKVFCWSNGELTGHGSRAV
jgi:hypothetical protein